jgi:hypothetical protein
MLYFKSSEPNVLLIFGHLCPTNALDGLNDFKVQHISLRQKEFLWTIR